MDKKRNIRNKELSRIIELLDSTLLNVMFYLAVMSWSFWAAQALFELDKIGKALKIFGFNITQLMINLLMTIGYVALALFIIIVLRYLIIGLVLGKPTSYRFRNENNEEAETRDELNKFNTTGFCTNCGTEIKKGNRFCTNCGKHIKALNK